MKEIPLTKGYVALVDDEDYEKLSQVPWCWSNGYAVTNARSKRFRRVFGQLTDTQQMRMSRLIVGAGPDTHVDHRNHQTLDNQKTNLRVTTHGGNLKNCVSRVGVSRFKGVCWSRVCLSWQAKIMSDRVNVHLGYFADETEAAKIYDRAAHTLHQEYALFNFPDDPQRFEPYQYRPAPRARSGFTGVTPSGSRFSARVDLDNGPKHLGNFGTAYDAALYRDHYIEKNNLTARMNF